jgi:hypothetical protein
MRQKMPPTGGIREKNQKSGGNGVTTRAGNFGLEREKTANPDSQLSGLTLPLTFNLTLCSVANINVIAKTVVTFRTFRTHLRIPANVTVHSGRS